MMKALDIKSLKHVLGKLIRKWLVNQDINEFALILPPFYDIIVDIQQMMLMCR